MLITLVLLLSTGSLLRVESHQSSNLTSSSSPPSSLNHQYHQSISSHHYSPSNGGLGHGHPTAVARRNLQQPFHYPQHQHQHSGPPSSSKSHSIGNSNGGSSAPLMRRYWPNPPQSHSSPPPPSPSASSSSISSLAPTSFLERRPTLFRGPRARPGFLDVLETSHQEMRVLPDGSIRPPPPQPHRHNRQLGHRPSKPEMTITELKDISQIPKILRAVKDRIQAMPGLKAFLLTKDGPSGPKIKPSILLTAPEEYSSKPGQLIWRLLNSKGSTKGSASFAKSLSSLASRQRYPSQPSAGLSSPPQQPSQPNSPSSGPQSSTSPNLSDKYTFIEVPSAIDIDGSSPFSESSFPNENIVINTSEHTESTPEEILIESSDNQMASNGLASTGTNVNNNINNAIGNNNHVNGNFNTLNGPIQTAESIVEAIEELPRTYYYRDTTEPKGYHHGPSGGSSDYLQANPSIRDNSFALSPFTINEHVPLSPVHNGWIPKNSKHWSPGAYRSAFYTPDTRLIKFTIHDRVSGSAKQSASPSIPIGTYVHPSLAVNPVRTKSSNHLNVNNNNNQFNVDTVNSNVNNNNYQQSNSRNSVSSKYGSDYFNHPSLIEESYNINDDELIKTTTTTSPTITTTASNSPINNKASIVVTLKPSPPASSSDIESSSPSTTTSQHNDKSTESSIPITTTIKPSSTITG